MANFTPPFLLLLLLVLPSFPPLLASVWCLENMDALLEVKKSLTEDPYRVLEHWIADNPEFCSLTVVTCDLGSSVVGLNLSAAFLAGLVPPALGWLARLQTLDLSSNWLTGFNPVQLANLVSLVLHSNFLSGLILPSLGSLSSLRILRLGNNSGISGSILDSLGDLQAWIRLSWAVKAWPSGEKAMNLTELAARRAGKESRRRAGRRGRRWRSQ